MNTLEKIKSLMEEKNLVLIAATYSGSGDSGEIESCDGYTAAGEQDNESVDLAGPARDLIWDLIEEHHSGFEINEGGFGSITLAYTPSIDTISLDFDKTDYVEETTNIKITISS